MEPEITQPSLPKEGKSIKYTAKVRRGLALMQLVAVNSIDPDKAPGFTTVKGWTKAQESDFNQAMTWVYQEIEGLS